jgi:hypothetical protein
MDFVFMIHQKEWEKKIGIILGFFGVASRTFAIKNLSMMLKRN